MNTLEVQNKNNYSIARKVQIVLADRAGQPQAIRADAAGKLPSSIEVLKVGMWRTPFHGDIMITPDDLQEYVDNFTAGIASASNGTLGLPINFGHDQGGKAAGWMKSLSVSGDTLMATVEWTDAGKAGLTSGEWKCFSPEFYPAGRGGWCDPLDEEHFVANVLEGGALTNMPLFSGLKPIMASALFGQGSDKTEVYLIKASEQTKEFKMATLEEVRLKEVGSLTEDEKTMLTENKDKLTAEEQAKFGFEVAAPKADGGDPAPADPAPAPGDDNGGEPAPVETPQAAAVAASIASGKSVVIEASALKRLEDTATAYEREKAQQIVKAHVARGAVKADKLDAWTDKVMADKTIEAMLNDLPSNPVLAAEVGSSTKAGEVQGTAWQQIEAKANAKVEASKGTIKFLDAVKQVTAENEQLAKEHEAERQEIN